MLAFITIQENYWGKGKSLTEAKTNLQKAKGSSTRGKYLLVMYNVKDQKAFDYIGINDFMEIQRGKEDVQLYQQMETL